MDYQKEIYVVKSPTVRFSKSPHWGRLLKKAREVTNGLALGMLTVSPSTEKLEEAKAKVGHQSHTSLW